MSCLSYVDSFSKKQSEEDKNSILSEALQCLKTQEEKQNQELFAFIDDFIKSPEYASYIKDKARIRRRMIAIQCNMEDVIVEFGHQKEQMVIMEKYPLTHEQKKMYAFKKHFEKYLKNREIEVLMEKQEQSIRAVKTKIFEARKVFECTKESRRDKLGRYEENLLQKYSTKFHIKLRFLNQQFRQKLLERFKKCHNVLTNRTKKRKENIIKIREKLSFEYRVKKRVKPLKIKRKFKIIENLDIGIKKEEIAVFEPIEEEDRDVELITDELIQEDVLVTEDKEQENKLAGKKKKSKNDKVEKKTDKTKQINKKVKKEKPDNDKLQLPTFPITNPRNKILPQNIDKIVDLVEEFREFDSQMEDRDMLQIRDYVIGDAGLIIKPDMIVFQGYEEGKKYKKTIKIINISTEVIKCRFLEFAFPEVNNGPLPFEIERFGIKKLFTGGSIKFFFNFQPYDESRAYEGNIAFVSYNVNNCEYHQFQIGVQCVPKYLDLKIYPEIVNFGDIPIWKAKDYDRVKVIKVQNKGSKSCTILIKKIFDPLDLDSILEDEEDKENSSLKSTTTNSTHAYVIDLLDDCIKNVENNFQFEPTFFSLDKMEEKRIKIFFKNASYVGDYLEKFTMDIFENFTSESLQIAGCQIIPLNAETTGHFLTTDPTILDFGPCIRNSCYQVEFEVFNSSSHTQAISIKVPSCLAEYVQSNISMVYLGPRSSRIVFLKFHPRETLKQSDCPYLDVISSVLEFSIRLCVVSKIASDYPPVKVPVYAIVTNFDDLTLSCHVGSHLSNFLNTLLVDMGDCSIYETQWFELTLNNNTEVTQFCGFDLPKAVTLAPNLGFCKLFPGRRKKFRLYLSPDIKDFPSFHIGSLKNSNYFFKIRVLTVAGLGQLEQVISPKKLKSSLDIMLQQLTAHGTELYESIMECVTVLKEQFADSPALTNDSLVNRDMMIMSRVCSILEKKCSTCAVTTQIMDQHDPACFDDNLLDFRNFVIVDTLCRSEVWCKVNLKRPLLEFSHQIVDFPDTPCGSYSVLEVKLTAREREMETPCQKKSKLEYRAHFEIVGNCKEILVEPCCGVLRSGENQLVWLPTYEIICTLDALPKTITLCDFRYILRGVVGYQGPEVGVGHFTAFCFRHNNMWQEFDDRCDKSKPCSPKKIVRIQILFYTL